MVAAWALVLAAGVGIGGGVFDRLHDGVGGGGNSESERAYRLLDRHRPQGPTIDLAAFVAGSPDNPALRRDVAKAAAELRTMPGVAAVLDPGNAQGLVAQDRAGVLVAVDVADGLRGDAHDATVRRAAERLHAIAAGPVSVGGGSFLDAEMDDTAQRDLERAELIALPLILLIMLLVFRSVRIALMPLAVALVSIAGSLLALLGFAAITDVSVFAVNVVTMLGLGLAVDYTLLAVSRFREERRRGLDVAEAVGRTVATAGRTILFSGLTVAVSLAGLLFLQGGLRSVALGGIGVVGVGILAALTLLPALLGMAGGRIRPASPERPDHGAFFRLSRLVQRRAGVIVPAVVGVLVLLAVPFTQARVQETDYRYLPTSSETRAFYQDLARHFPNQTAEPIIVVAVRVAGVSPQAYTRYLERLRALPGVRSARVQQGGPLDVVDVAPEAATQSQLSYRLVSEIRAMHPPFETLVTGQAAELVDERAALLSRLPFVLGFVVAATFVLLFLMTGSVVVPAKALAMNVLSLSASFGALVWVFEDGHLAGLLGFTPTGSVEIVVPVLVFAFAFGLSMDYEVFLLSRIKEAYDRTGDNDLAVAAGLQRTGRMVTTAALLMAAVFGGFAAGDMLAVKQVGVGLVLAVALDATLIRLLLVPATMKLMGRWNWWAPVPLRRLHARFGLREQLEPPRSRGMELEEAPSLEPVG